MGSAFMPSGKTVRITAADPAPTGVQAPHDTGGTGAQFRLHNNGSVTAHVAFGKTATEAQTNAVIATGSGASSKKSIPLPPGAIEVISAPADSFWSAITASSTASVYVTPGRGL